MHGHAVNYLHLQITDSSRIANEKDELYEEMEDTKEQHKHYRSHYSQKGERMELHVEIY